MSRESANDKAEKLLLAFDLFQAGEDLMRENLRRRAPLDDEATIEKRLGEWLLSRPGAEMGDAVGRAIAWPREKP